MAAIYNPKIRVTSVRKISTPEFDKANDGYAEWKVTAEIVFNVFGEDQCDAEDDARKKLNHVLY